MEFLNPGMLSLLGLIPVLILIHALRPKSREAEVTNLYLWQDILKERSSNIALKRVKKNLPLLFQILIVILTALALANPMLLNLIHDEGDIILVLDTSASMKTRLARGTRFDRARQKALELVDQLDNDQRILIIEAGSKPVMKSGFLENAEQARTLVNSINPTDAPARLEKSLYLALSFVDPARDEKIYFITDSAGYARARLLQNHHRIIPVIITGGENNAGITKFEFRQELEKKDKYEIMIEVKNFNREPVIFPIHLSIGKTIIFNTSISLKAQEKKLLIIPYTGLITGIAKAVIEKDDDFSVDNTAWLSLNRAGDIWVLLLSKGNYFLEKLLEAYPNFFVTRIKKIDPSTWKKLAGQHDIIIADRMNFPQIDKGNFLIINSFSPSLPVSKTGSINFPGILYWDKKSPLMENVNLSGLTIERAAMLSGNRLKPVIESSQTGLVYTYEKDGFRSVIFSFDISRSNLPLKVAFPVMMSNIINWLNPHKLKFSTMQAKAGEPFDIYLAPRTESFTVRTPGEKWVKYRPGSNPLKYKNTNRVGVYTILENDKERYFTVNLLNESESEIKVPVVESSGIDPSSGESNRILSHQPLWAFLLLLVLAMLVLEWHFWLKKG